MNPKNLVIVALILVGVFSVAFILLPSGPDMPGVGNEYGDSYGGGDFSGVGGSSGKGESGSSVTANGRSGRVGDGSFGDSSSGSGLDRNGGQGIGDRPGLNRGQGNGRNGNSSRGNGSDLNGGNGRNGSNQGNNSSRNGNNRGRSSSNDENRSGAVEVISPEWVALPARENRVPLLPQTAVVEESAMDPLAIRVLAQVSIETGARESVIVRD